MGKINVLDFHVANLIAAGEVVDRPASVVKELLENAIDAGAHNVTVEIKRGGVSFIRVTDDGCGIARDDVPVALKRHATSKIRDESDLTSISTLGFRGEALAAISAVSKIRIMTKQKDDAIGTLLEAHGGKVISVSDTGCPDGTTILCEELFYNTPARLKFLKRDGTEAGNVAAYVEKIALSHPEIALRFLSDGELRYATAGNGDRKSTVYAVLGREFAKKTVEIKGGFDGVTVSGFIGTPENVRGNRNFQIFFINNRYVKSKTVSAALEQAYATYIPGEKFPCAVLWMTCAPEFVDVNVHPAKLEVKFASERTVFESVYYAVRNALANHLEQPTLSLEQRVRQIEKQQRATLSPVPLPTKETETKAPEPITVGFAEAEQIPPPDDSDAPPENPFSEGVTPSDLSSTIAEDTAEPILTDADISVPKITYEQPHREIPRTETPRTEAPRIPVTEKSSRPNQTGAVVSVQEKQSDSGRNADTEDEEFQDNRLNIAPKEDTPISPKMSQTEKQGEVRKPPFTYIGELYHCYLLCEMDGTVYVIDKHAAHERILFEKMRREARSGLSAMQELLIPMDISLSSEELAFAQEYKRELRAIGFEFSHETGEHVLHLSTVPSYFTSEESESAFCEAVHDLYEHAGNATVSRDARFEHALFQAACKAAIKGGREYDESQHKWICERVFSDPAIRVCPHGRPVCFVLKESELEKRFQRS